MARAGGRERGGGAERGGWVLPSLGSMVISRQKGQDIRSLQGKKLHENFISYSQLS